MRALYQALGWWQLSLENGPITHSIPSCYYTRREKLFWNTPKLRWHESNQFPSILAKRIKPFSYCLCCHRLFNLPGIPCLACWRTLPPRCLAIPANCCGKVFPLLHLAAPLLKLAFCPPRAYPSCQRMSKRVLFRLIPRASHNSFVTPPVKQSGSLNAKKSLKNFLHWRLAQAQARSNLLQALGADVGYNIL